jgi:hypothetical protein
MKSLEYLKEQLQDILINSDGDVKLSEHLNIIANAREVGLDDRQLSNLLIEVDNGINWDFIRKQNKEKVIREEALREALDKQKQNELNAVETLEFIIKQCSKDKVFSSSEIKVYFETSEELKLKEIDSAKYLMNYFENNNYIPLTTPKGSSLRILLETTEWYKDKLPKSINSKSEPKDQLLGASFLLVFGIIWHFSSWYIGLMWAFIISMFVHVFNLYYFKSKR